MDPIRRLLWAWVSILVISMIFLIGGIGGYYAIGAKVEMDVKEFLVVNSKDDPNYDRFITSDNDDHPTEYSNLYLWHVTNPSEVIQGQTPILEEKGPYPFKRHWVREDVYYNAGTVQFNFYSWFSWEGDHAEGASLDDEITLTNPSFGPLLNGEDSMQARLVSQTLSKFGHKFGGNVDEDTKRIFESFDANNALLKTFLGAANKLYSEDPSAVFQAEETLQTELSIGGSEAKAILEFIDDPTNPLPAYLLVSPGVSPGTFDRVGVLAATLHRMHPNLKTATPSSWNSVLAKLGRNHARGETPETEVAQSDTKTVLAACKVNAEGKVNAASLNEIVSLPEAEWVDICSILLALDVSPVMDLTELFVTKTVREYLKGDDPLTSYMGGAMPLLSNNTRSGKHVMHTGEKDVNLINEYIIYNNQSYFDIWNTRVNVTGTDGRQFRPGLTGEEELFIFSKELLRPLTFVKYDDTDVSGVPTHRYHMDPDMWNCKGKIQRKKCDDFNIIQSGVVDLSPTLGVPLVMTPTRFYSVDDERNYTALYNITDYESELHQSFIDVEPYSGSKLRGARRFQLNFLLDNFANVEGRDKYKNVPQDGLLVPVAWIDDFTEISEVRAEEIRDKVIAAKRISFLMLAGVVPVGGLLFITGSIMYFYYRRKNNAAFNQTRSDKTLTAELYRS